MRKDATGGHARREGEIKGIVKETYHQLWLNRQMETGKAVARHIFHSSEWQHPDLLGSSPICMCRLHVLPANIPNHIHVHVGMHVCDYVRSEYREPSTSYSSKQKSKWGGVKLFFLVHRRFRGI